MAEPWGRRGSPTVNAKGLGLEVIAVGPLFIAVFVAAVFPLAGGWALFRA
jgi:hypothetical protein